MRDIGERDGQPAGRGVRARVGPVSSAHISPAALLLGPQAAGCPKPVGISCGLIPATRAGRALPGPQEQSVAASGPLGWRAPGRICASRIYRRARNRRPFFAHPRDYSAKRPQKTRHQDNCKNARCRSAGARGPVDELGVAPRDRALNYPEQSCQCDKKRDRCETTSRRPKS
jgi:hypothetical protein